jgi:hypothetical protein
MRPAPRSLRALRGQRSRSLDADERVRLCTIVRGPLLSLVVPAAPSGYSLLSISAPTVFSCPRHHVAALWLRLPVDLHAARPRMNCAPSFAGDGTVGRRSRAVSWLSSRSQQRYSSPGLPVGAWGRPSRARADYPASDSNSCGWRWTRTKPGSPSSGECSIRLQRSPHPSA